MWFNLVDTVEAGAGATSSGMAHVVPGERKAEFTGSLSVSRAQNQLTFLPGSLWKDRQPPLLSQAEGTSCKPWASQRGGDRAAPGSLFLAGRAPFFSGSQKKWGLLNRPPGTSDRLFVLDPHP